MLTLDPNIPRLLEISAFSVLVVKGYKQCVALPDNRYTETRNITARAKPLARKDRILAFLLDFYDFLAKLRFTIYF